jgi:CRP/FNR family cyclic AMP-dependent transcriptional regulator
MADIALLKEGMLFANLTDKELKRFAAISETSDLDSGAIIIEEGAEGDGIYIVEEGQVIVSKSEGEVRSTIVTLERGEQFGEMSLIESAPTSARVSADGAVKLIKIPRNKFMELLEKDYKIAAKVYKALAYSLSRRLRATSSDLVTWKPGFDL